MNKKIFKTAALAFILAVAVIFTACGSDTVDEGCYKSIAGDYKVDSESGIDVGEWWRLAINEEKNVGKKFSIYDGEAGNPGVEGTIVILNKDTIKVEIDPEFYDQLPTNKWKCDGETLELNYVKTEDGIELTNNKTTVKFEPDIDIMTLCGRWGGDKSEKLSSFEINGNTLKMSGWVYQAGEPGVGGIWSNETYNFELSDACMFIDSYFGTADVSAEDFVKLLEKKDAKGAVIEVDVVGKEAVNIRLMKEKESRLHVTGDGSC